MSQVNVIAVICFRNVIRCVESRLVGRPQSFVENALELKAYYIGSANRDCQNPFVGFDHPLADRLSRSFDLGCGNSSE